MRRNNKDIMERWGEYGTELVERKDINMEKPHETIKTQQKIQSRDGEILRKKKGLNREKLWRRQNNGKFIEGATRSCFAEAANKLKPSNKTRVL